MTAAKLVREARDLLAAGHADPAAELLEQAIACAPDDKPALRAQIASLLLRTPTDPDRRHAFIRQSAELAPDSGAAHYLLARSMLRQKHPSGHVVSELEQAVELAPGLAAAHHLLGIVLQHADPHRGYRHYLYSQRLEETRQRARRDHQRNVLVRQLLLVAAPLTVLALVYATVALLGDPVLPTTANRRRPPSPATATQLPEPPAGRPAAEAKPEPIRSALAVESPEPSLTSRVDEAADNEQIRALVETWRRDWERGDVDAYGAHYGTRFHAQGRDRAAWLGYKAGVFRSSLPIRVEISALQVRLGPPGKARAVFEQRYASNVSADLGVKTLDLERESGVWRIHGEVWQPLSPP